MSLELIKKALLEQGIQRQSYSGIPTHTTQKGQPRWRYSVIGEEGGDRTLRLSMGDKTMQWRLNGADDATRIADLPSDHQDDSEVHASGAAQIHKSSPTAIHATMQDGRVGSTFNLIRQKGDSWKLHLKPAKEPLENTALRFVTAMKEKTASLKIAIIEKQDGEYTLWTKDKSRVLGKHKSRLAAIKQEYAIQKSQEAKSGDKLAKLAHVLAHYSRNQHEELRPLSYDELTKDRTSGRWEDKPEMAEAYVKDRKKLESALHKRLAAKGVTTDPNNSFLYATIDGKESFGNPDSGFKHTSNLDDETIRSSFFDVVGAGKGRTTQGLKGLQLALKKWDAAKAQGKLQESEYMGMKIRPRIEVITPCSITPEKIDKVAIDQQLRDRIATAASKVNTDPTDKEKDSGVYQKGHVTIQGLRLSIENPKGSIRRGKDKNGNEWKITLKNHYCYIKGTRGADKDHLDVFVGRFPESESVFVVDQVDPKTGKWNEHKIVVGEHNESDAKKTYLQNYSDSWKGLGAITHLTIDQFHKWLKSGNTQKKIEGQHLSIFKKKASVTPKLDKLAALTMDQLTAPLTHPDPIIAAGAGALTGAVGGAGIHYFRKLKRTLTGEDEPEDEPGLLRHMGLGAALGGGVSLAWRGARNTMGGYQPIQLPHPDPTTGQKVFENVDRDRYLEHPDATTGQPIYQLANGDNNPMLISMMRKLEGNPLHSPPDAPVHDWVKPLPNEEGIQAASGRPSWNQPRPISFNKKSTVGKETLIAQIINDYSLSTYEKSRLIAMVEQADDSNVPLDRSSLMNAGLGALAGWIAAQLGGFGGIGQAVGAGLGAGLGAMFTQPSTATYHNGYTTY